MSENDRPTDEEHIWERWHNETGKCYGVFIIYRDLGARRSLKSACRRFYGDDYTESKLRNANEWSRRFHWGRRALAWDEYLDREARIAQREAVVEMNKRHAAIAKVALGKVIHALSRLDPDDLDVAGIRMLGDWGARLERLCHGEATEHVRQDVRAAGKGNRMEVVESIVVVGADGKERAEPVLLPDSVAGDAAAPGDRDRRDPEAQRTLPAPHEPPAALPLPLTPRRNRGRPSALAYFGDLGALLGITPTKAETEAAAQAAGATAVATAPAPPPAPSSGGGAATDAAPPAPFTSTQDAPAADFGDFPDFPGDDVSGGDVGRSADY